MVAVINEVKGETGQMKIDYLEFENERIVEKLTEIEEYRSTVMERVEALEK